MLSLRVDTFAETLGMGTTLQLLLPPGVPEPPVLYLLHGLSDDATSWLRRTSIERYAEAYGVAVVMPPAARSFYCNETHGLAWWDWISAEVPAQVAHHFRVSTDPARTYVAGFSMGGYGALKLALRHPERFRAAASLSGAVDVAGMAALAAIPPEALDAIERDGFTAATVEAAAATLHVQADQLLRYLGQPPGTEILPSDGPQAAALLHSVVAELRRRRTMIHTIWGDRPPAATGDDLFALVDASDPAALPPLFSTCGSADGLAEDNRRFAQRCADRGVGLRAEFLPGEHAWEYWDAQIQTVLAWFPDLPQISLEGVRSVD